MMKKIIFVINIFLFNTFIFSQPQFNEIHMTPFWDFYAHNNLSAVSNGKGGTGVAAINDLSGVPINPASLRLQDKFSINAGVIYKTDMQWLRSLNIAELQLKTILPTVFAGVGYRINDKISTGIIYQNDYSYQLDYGEIIRTNEFGEETGRYDAYLNINRHTLTIPAVYSSGNLSLGLNLNASYLRGFQEFDNDTANLSSNNFIFYPQLGMQVQITKNLRGGIMITPGFTKNIKWKNSGSDDANDDVHYPWRASGGLNYSFGSNNLSLEYHYEGTSAEENLKDRHNIKFGFESKADKNWTLRTGAATLFDYRKGDNITWLDPVGRYDEFFITAGAGYRNENYSIDFSVMNSNLGSKELAQTVLNLNFRYEKKAVRRTVY